MNKNKFVYTGFLNIYKEAGFTSHDVVAKLRGMLRQKKIGHMGTLDPEAEGVLPIALGGATKAIALLEDHTKEYDATLVLGICTDTYDMSGKVLQVKTVKVSEDEVCTVLESFLGEQMQIPPMYSAKKQNGRKLYELARAGIVVERQAVPIYIDEISILSVDLPYVRMHISCSKGTYIRSLCHDIGAKLGCGGCMQDLVRTRAGQFVLDTAVRLSEIQRRIDYGEDWTELVLATDCAFFSLPALLCDEQARKRAVNGNPLWKSDLHALQITEKGITDQNIINATGDNNIRQKYKVDVCDTKNHHVAKDDLYRIYIDKNKFLGIYTRSGNKFLPRKVFI